MAICDFDMMFKYVVVGWEGTAHDSRVLTETICNPSHNFPMPPDGNKIQLDYSYIFLMACSIHILCYLIKLIFHLLLN